MNFFELDWRQLLAVLPAWKSLDDRVKRTVLSNFRSKGHIDIRALGPFLKVLKEHGFIRDSESGRWVDVNPEMHKVVVALRAMHRNTRWSLPGHFREYTLQLLGFDERAYLEDCCPGVSWQGPSLDACATTVAWLTDFPDIDRRQKHHVSIYTLFYRESAETLPGILKATEELLQVFMKQPAPIALADIYDCAGEKQRTLVLAALKAGVRRLIFYPYLRSDDLEPVIGLWPPISERLHRPRAVPATPLPATPRETFSLPFWMEDVTTVAISCAGAPFKLRQGDGAIYARRQRELAEQLMRLPDWIVRVLQLEPYNFSEKPEDVRHPRLERALALLKAFGWLGGGPHRVSLNSAGLDWLKRSPRERLAEILDGFRTGREANKDLYGEPLTKRLVNDYRFMEPSSGRRRSTTSYFPLAELGEAFGPLGVGVFQCCNRFVDYECRSRNPLLPAPGKWRIEGGYREVMPTEEKLEEVWKEVLQGYLLWRLVPLGGAALGHNGPEDKSIYFAITDIGRYLLGLAEEFKYAHDASGKVVVQPNFEIVFLGPSPSTEAICGRFAERVSKSRHVGTLFRITKRSCVTAAAAGMSAGSVLETLTQASQKAIPENVTHEIKSWFGQCRSASLRTATLIECPDAETTTAIEASGIHGLKRLNDVTLEVSISPGVEARRRLGKKLRERGIFLKPSTKEERKEHDW